MQNVYHRHFHAFRFKTVQKQKSTMFYEPQLMLQSSVKYTVFVARLRYQRVIFTMVLK